MKNRRIETRTYRPNTRIQVPGEPRQWEGDDVLDAVVGFVCVVITLAIVVGA